MHSDKALRGRSLALSLGLVTIIMNQRSGVGLGVDSTNPELLHQHRLLYTLKVLDLYRQFQPRIINTPTRHEFRLEPISRDPSEDWNRLLSAGDFTVSNRGGSLFKGNATVIHLGKKSNVPSIQIAQGVDWSFATALNASGLVVGEATAANGYFHAFLYNGKQTKDLGTLGGAYSEATSINPKGEITGAAEVAERFITELPAHGPSGMTIWPVLGIFRRAHMFLYHSGKMIDLTPTPMTWSFGHDINSRGDVVGTVTGPHGFRPYGALWSAGKLVDLNEITVKRPNVNITTAFAINDSGQILACGRVDSNPAHSRYFLLVPVE